jgi:hypothetical protein
MYFTIGLKKTQTSFLVTTVTIDKTNYKLCVLLYF